MTPTIALTIDARYFFCGAKELDWEWQGGTYSGFNEVFIDWEYDDADFKNAEDATTALKIKPSFFSIRAGIKIYFGRT
jgi:hypothetical protein